MKQALEMPDLDTEDVARPPHVIGRLADRYPPRLTTFHLMEIFEIKRSWFSELLRRGKFDRFLLRPTIGRRAWSRELVQRYLDQAGA
jgi:hypothetical protein